MPYFHETTPEKEAKIAADALASGDLAHAAYHIGTALAHDPLKPEWLEVLNEVIRRSPDVLTLLRLDASRSDFITAATRAYALAALNKVQEALGLVVPGEIGGRENPDLVGGVLRKGEERREDHAGISQDHVQTALDGTVARGE